MQKLMIALVVVALVLFGFFAIRGIRSVAARGDAITQGLINRYVGLLQQGQVEAAWADCVSEGLQGSVTHSEFARAHEARAQEYGALQGWTQTDYQHEANLFSKESVIGINGVLHYERRDVFVLYKVDPDVQPYRIQQMFGSAGSSTMMSEGIW